MSLRYLACVSAACLLAGCGSSSNSSAVDPGPSSVNVAPTGSVNTLRVVDPDGTHEIDGHPVKLMVLTGYDSQGRLVFGPVEEPYDESIDYSGLPDNVVTVELAFHRGQGAALGHQRETVNFATLDHHVVHRIAPTSAGFNVRNAFTVRIENKSDYPDDQVFVTVTGKNRAQSAYYYVDFASGNSTPFGPVSDSAKYSEKLSALKKEGEHVYSFQCPYENLVSGRIYLAFGQKLQGLGLNNVGDPLSLQEPSCTGAPDFQTLFEFMELSATAQGDVYTLFANTSVVDFFSMGLGMTMQSTRGNETVGFVDGARDKVLAEFQSSSTPSEFSTGRAVIKKGDKVLRVLGPNQITAVEPEGSMASYLNSAIDEGWTKFSRTVLNIPDNLPARRYGFTYTGQLIANNMLPMTCTAVPDGQTGLGQTSRLPKPTSRIIFFCDDPAPPPDSWNNGSSDGHKRLCSLLSSAFNRGVFDNYPDWGDATKFYTRPDKKYNYYAKILHQFALNGKVYGFGYDDVYGQDPTLAEPLSSVNQVVITIPKVPVL